MKLRSDLDPGYIAALGRLFKRIEGLLADVPREHLPLRLYVAGGAAALFHAGVRASRDVDAVLSLRVHLPALEEAYTDRNGDVASVYLDPTYNDTLGPSHEDALADAEHLEMPGVDASTLDVRVLAPVDLAISKLGRFNDHDRDDIRALASAGLLAADELQKRAEQALDYYVGHPAAPRANLREALAIVKRHSPSGRRPRGAGRKRSKKGG